MKISDIIVVIMTGGGILLSTPPPNLSSRWRFLLVTGWLRHSGISHPSTGPGVSPCVRSGSQEWERLRLLTLLGLGLRYGCGCETVFLNVFQVKGLGFDDDCSLGLGP